MSVGTLHTLPTAVVPHPSGFGVRPWWLDDPTLTVARVQSSAGGAATCTLTAPGTGYRRRVVRVDGGYDADPTGGRLTVTSDPAGTPAVLYSVPVTKSGPAPLPDLLLAGAENKAVSVALAAGGGSILADVVVWSVTEAV